MKKLITLLIVSIWSAFCFAQDMKFNYIITQDTVVYSDNDDNPQKEEIRKDNKITIDPYSDVLYKSWISGINTVLLDNGKGFIPVSFVKPEDSEDFLPVNLITHDSKKRIKNLIPAYYLEILKASDMKLLEKYEKYFNISYVSSIGPFTAEGITNNVSDCGIYFFSENKILFKKIIKKTESLFECEGAGNGDWDPYTTDLDCFRWSSLLKNTPENETEKFLFELDGDYLKISYASSNKPIITLVYVSDSTMDELEHLFRTNTCNLTKVTWPRHADGTCDYDNSKATAETISANQPAPSTTSASTTSVAVKKLMTTNCNLKLRAAEATSSNVLTVMAQGTKVKILELGKAETIDGISSNWVKVEVQKGAKDRDGKPIAKGLVGWAYGGYLE